MCSTGGITATQVTNPTAEMRPYWTAGLQGQNIIVGVGDTGLDVGHCRWERGWLYGAYVHGANGQRRSSQSVRAQPRVCDAVNASYPQRIGWRVTGFYTHNSC